MTFHREREGIPHLRTVSRKSNRATQMLKSHGDLRIRGTVFIRRLFAGYQCRDRFLLVGLRQSIQQLNGLIRFLDCCCIGLRVFRL